MKLADIIMRRDHATTRGDVGSAWQALLNENDPWGRFDQPVNEKPSSCNSSPSDGDAEGSQRKSPEQFGRSSSNPLPEALLRSAEEETAAPSTRTIPTILPPPLRHIPPSWGVEVQRIVHHLFFGRTPPPRVILFSALGPQSGTSTISFMVAHHRSCSTPETRTLLLTFSTRSPAANVAMTALKVGSAFSWRQLSREQVLSVVSLQGGEGFSVAEKERWFRSLITTARKNYDVVFIDVPPFARCAESYLLAGLADGVVLVLRSGEVRKPALKSLLDELRHMDIKVIGSVLNFRSYPLPDWLIRLL